MLIEDPSFPDRVWTVRLGGDSSGVLREFVTLPLRSALIEGAPRCFATLALDALDVTEHVGALAGRAWDDVSVPHALAWQTQRLARQVAEIAQRLAGDTGTVLTVDTWFDDGGGIITTDPLLSAVGDALKDRGVPPARVDAFLGAHRDDGAEAWVRFIGPMLDEIEEVLTN